MSHRPKVYFPSVPSPSLLLGLRSRSRTHTHPLQYVKQLGLGAESPPIQGCFSRVNCKESSYLPELLRRTSRGKPGWHPNAARRSECWHLPRRAGLHACDLGTVACAWRLSSYRARLNVTTQVKGNYIY